MRINVLLLVALASGALAVTCTSGITSIIYGFAAQASISPNSSASCTRQVAGYCVAEGYRPGAQTINARDVIVVGTVSGAASIDECVSNYCSPNLECKSASLDRTDPNNPICSLLGNNLDELELIADPDFDVGYNGPHSGTSSVSSEPLSTSTTGTSSESTIAPLSSLSTSSLSSSSSPSSLPSSTSSSQSSSSGIESSPTLSSSSSSSSTSASSSASATPIVRIVGEGSCPEMYNDFCIYRDGTVAGLTSQNLEYQGTESDIDACISNSQICGGFCYTAVYDPNAAKYTCTCYSADSNGQVIIDQQGTDLGILILK